MSIEQNKAIVRRDNDAVWTQGNAAVINELYASNVVDHDPMPGLQATGRELQRQTLEILHSAFPDFSSRIDLLVVEGDTVAAQMTVSGTHRGQFMNMPPTGKMATWKLMTMYRLKNGQIAELWHVVDALGLLAQLGLLPTDVPVGTHA